MDAMFESLKQMIGSKPKNFSSDFDGATLWNILENFAARFSSFDKEMKDKVIVINKCEDCKNIFIIYVFHWE